MKICIFGAASAHIDEKYIKRVEELGERLARQGHSLVFGCGATGLMGAAARGFKAGGGEIFGVVPEFFKAEGVEQLFTDCTKTIYTADMSERKRVMEDLADAFIITPGGVGTLEEFYEVLTLKQLGRHKKAIAVFNIDGYFNPLEEFMQSTVKNKFVASGCLKLYEYCPDVASVCEYIKNYRPNETPWKKLKITE